MLFFLASFFVLLLVRVARREFAWCSHYYLARPFGLLEDQEFDFISLSSVFLIIEGCFFLRMYKKVCGCVLETRVVCLRDCGETFLKESKLLF